MDIPTGSLRLVSIAIGMADGIGPTIGITGETSVTDPIKVAITARTTETSITGTTVSAIIGGGVITAATTGSVEAATGIAAIIN